MPLTNPPPGYEKEKKYSLTTPPPETGKGPMSETFTPPDEISQDYPLTRSILKGARTVLETGGMIGGGILGGGAGLSGGLAAPVTVSLGVLAGEAGGYVVGKKAADVLDAVFSYTRPDRSYRKEPDLKTRLMDIPGELITGAAYSAGGAVAGKLIPKSRISEDITGLAGREAKSAEVSANLEAFKAEGLNPLPSEALAKETSRTAAGIESALSYSPFSANTMYKRALERLDDLNMRRESLVRQGAPLDEIDQVGRAIKNEAEDLIKKNFDVKGEFLQKKVDEFVTGLSKNRTNYNAGETFQGILSKTQTHMAERTSGLYNEFASSLGKSGKVKIPISMKLTQTADEIYSKEIAQKEGLRNTKLLNIVKPYTTYGLKTEARKAVSNFDQLDNESQSLIINSLRKNTGQDFMTMKETRTRMNEIIAERKRRGIGLNDTYNKRLMDLDTALENDQMSYANSIGKGDEYKSIVAERKTYHDLFNEDTLKIMQESPQKIAGQIIARNDISTYKLLRSQIGEDAVAPIKEAHFDDILKTSMGKDGMLDGSKFAIKYAKIEPELLREMLTPEQQKMVQQLINRANSIKINLRNSKVVDFLKDITLRPNQNVVSSILEAHNPEKAKMASRLFTEDQLKKLNQQAIAQTLAISKEGNILPITSAGNFTKYKSALKELLPKESFDHLESFIKVGQNAKRVEQLALNASQTGQLLIYRDTLRRLLVNPLVGVATLGALGGTKSAVTAAATEVAGIGINVALAKIYLSPAALRFFTTSLKLSPESPMALSLFTKAIAIAYEDHQEEMQEFNNKTEQTRR